jgi:phage terminase large subunit
MTGKVNIQIPIEYKPLFETWWRHALIEGGRYSLKSHTIARRLLIAGRQKKMRFGCFREFQNSIAESSLQLLTDLIEKYEMADYVVTRDSIVNKITGSDFLFKGLRHNAQSVKSLEGIDIAWIEEAQTISKESIDILIPTIRKPGSQIIWSMNRLLELDPIYEMLALHERDDTLHLKINYDVAEKYGWLPKEIKAEIEFDKENHPDLYQHKWLGQPMSQVDNAIVGRTSVLEAMQRTVSDEGAVEIGADIARMGNDRTVFKKRKGHKLIGTKVYTKLRTTEVCDKLEEFAEYDKSLLIKVDDTGLGGGVTDEMMKRGYNIMPINFGAKANEPDKYPNLISEAWFYVAKIMPDIELEMDSDLLMELSSRMWVMDSKGRRGVESKDSYKKRGYRSPDMADATILCFYTPLIQKAEYATADDLF